MRINYNGKHEPASLDDHPLAHSGAGHSGPRMDPGASMTTAEQRCDLFVIGAGSGGVRAARRAAERGARVVVAEHAALGGTCVNVGCIPKKLLHYAAEHRWHFRAAAHYGWRLDEPRLDWPALRDSVAAEVARLNGIYARLLAEAGVELASGSARLEGGHAVRVGERRWRAEHILIACGGTPHIPDFPGRELALRSDDMFCLASLPEQLLIVGGGYIAVEFASIFSALGVSVTLAHRGELPLRGFDEDLRRVTAEGLARSGVDARWQCTLTGLSRNGHGGLSATLRQNGAEHAITVAAALCATGRRPDIDSLGLEHTAVSVDSNGAIAVNAQCRSHDPAIFAIGDAIGSPALTPVAIREGEAVVQTLFGDQPTEMHYEWVPSAVFGHPTLGTVGLGEAAARERGADCEVYWSEFIPLRHRLGDHREKTAMKLVVERGSGRLLGAHMAGESADEIAQMLAVAMQAGASKASLDSAFALHPTSAEEFLSMHHPRVQ